MYNDKSCTYDHWFACRQAGKNNAKHEKAYIRRITPSGASMQPGFCSKAYLRHSNSNVIIKAQVPNPQTKPCILALFTRLSFRLCPTKPVRIEQMRKSVRYGYLLSYSSLKIWNKECESRCQVYFLILCFLFLISH